jgi:hypothetical protein
VIRSRPRKIRVLLAGKPEKQKLVPEGTPDQGLGEVRFDPFGERLVGISRAVNC